ncbi:ABC transporter ATP-binding protein [Bacillaceae bacterium Marseille-Q3522]|nr:ABC transporter ATP-binding protein [Bacillaceae bacterium Marseille-Q3522]
MLTIDDEKKLVLNNIHLKIKQGEFISIMGKSGSGKSTLLNILGFLDSEFNGVYLFENENVTNKTDKEISFIRNNKVGFVFRNFNLLDMYTIFENVQLPLLYNNQFTLHKKDILKTLDKVGLLDKANKYPSQLSGGQLQRVAIARAIINDPSFILADEPTGSLDTNTAKDIMGIFKKIHQDGKTIVLVTHDYEIADYAEKTIILQDGILSKMG